MFDLQTLGAFSRQGLAKVCSIMYGDDRGFERAMNLFSNFNQTLIALSEVAIFTIQSGKKAT